MSDVATLNSYAEEILAVAADAVATTIGGPIDRAFVSTTRPALDCCPQLTVDLRSFVVEQLSPSTPVAAAGQRSKLRIVYVAGYVVTVVRCSTAADVSQGGLPATGPIAALALETSEDLWAVWNAVRQKWNDGSGFLDGNCKDLYPDPPTPVNQEGGCVGWELPFRVWVDGYDPLP